MNEKIILSSCDQKFDNQLLMNEVLLEDFDQNPLLYA